MTLLALMGAMFAAPPAPTALARDGRKEPGGTPDGGGG